MSNAGQARLGKRKSLTLPGDSFCSEFCQNLDKRGKEMGSRHGLGKVHQAIMMAVAGGA